jgi:hypothetical protein
MIQDPADPIMSFAGSNERDAVELEKKLKLTDPRSKIARRVCLIERDDGAECTGFLVAPDLMLTAAHGLRGTTGIFADPETVTIKFDHFLFNRKSGLKAIGDQCKLRRLPFSRPRQPDVLASSIKCDARCRRQRKRDGDNGLDYVLVRLDRPIGLSFLPFSYRIRGWNNCSRADVPPAGKVFVVQHPFGGLQRFATGTVPANHVDEEFRHFFKYNTTAVPGTSGAPILDQKYRVVGMHIGERSKTEQLGISFQKIFADLTDEGVRLPPFRLTKRMMDSVFGTSRIEYKRKRGRDWRGDRLFDGVRQG